FVPFASPIRRIWPLVAGIRLAASAAKIFSYALFAGVALILE
ncbi:hypothetical protein A2U01_0040171, partial [Trifolium medium]|nr:hypothetical protein [Trifolium medium]